MKLTFTGDWLPRGDLPPDLGKDGVFVGNLECAFSDRKVASGKAYTSIVSSAMLDIVAKSAFSALSVANNHAYDAGEKAFDSELEALSRVAPQIQVFGTTDRPYAMFDDVVVIGCLEPCRSRGPRIFREEDVLGLLHDLSNGEFASKSKVVYPHWGKEGEYTRYPSPAQRRLAQNWIKAGAVAVIGSHSHVPQGRERIGGAPVYYSLGNFDFDHPESKLYAGTSDRVTVSLTIDGVRGLSDVNETFDLPATRAAVESASEALRNWSTWEWAKAVGSFNVSKNMASWRIRLKENLPRTLPKFIVWQCLPKTVLFRIAGLFGRR